MARTAQRVAYPLTFVLKREGRQWASLAPEVNIASCGKTVDEARQALEEAVETYVLYLLRAGRASEIARPLSEAEVDDFVNDPPGVVKFERWVMFVKLRPSGAKTEFVPTANPEALVGAGSSSGR